MASRSLEKLAALAETVPGGAEIFQVDCARNESIVSLFQQFDAKFENQPPSVVLYNASYSGGGSYAASTVEIGTHTDYDDVNRAVQITAVGAFVAGQEAGKRMVPHNNGAIFFTGATAVIKAFPKRGTFALGKFALRGLAQSLYKELSPLGIHVVHFVIDGGVRPYPGETLESLPEDAFTAEAIATSYWLALSQPKGAWSWEIELRSKDEKF